jgi:hypothetical protein
VVNDLSRLVTARHSIPTSPLIRILTPYNGSPRLPHRSADSRCPREEGPAHRPGPSVESGPTAPLPLIQHSKTRDLIIVASQGVGILPPIPI